MGGCWKVCRLKSSYDDVISAIDNFLTTATLLTEVCTPHIYIYIYIRVSLNKFPDFFHMGTFIDSTQMNHHRDIGPAVRVCSIPGRVIPKTLKMELDTTLLNTQHYKVRFKGKVEQSWSSALPYTLV